MSPKKPHTIALIAHDGKKAEMVSFAKDNAATLARYHLIATGTTGELLQTKAGLDLQRMQSGPVGGDAQIAAKVVEGEISAVFFFVDPLGKHPHDPDIQMLLRICNVHNVPLATNEASAMCIMTAIEVANTPPEQLGHISAMGHAIRFQISSQDAAE
jgi:methylglyoxal synthase